MCMYIYLVLIITTLQYLFFKILSSHPYSSNAKVLGGDHIRNLPKEKKYLFGTCPRPRSEIWSVVVRRHIFHMVVKDRFHFSTH